MKIQLYERGSKCSLHNEWGNWEVRPYRHKVNPNEIHLAIVSTKLDPSKPVLIRIHSSCLMGDVLHDKACDCRDQLNMAFAEMAKEGGVIFYLNQEGRNIGLWNKINAYALKERGFDTIEANEYLGLPADNRNYGMVAEMLSDIGVTSVKMMTNNPDKVKAIRDLGIAVTRIPAKAKGNKFNKKYLYCKKKKLNHLI